MVKVQLCKYFYNPSWLLWAKAFAKALPLKEHSLCYKTVPVSAQLIVDAATVNTEWGKDLLWVSEDEFACRAKGSNACQENLVSTLGEQGKTTIFFFSTPFQIDSILSSNICRRIKWGEGWRTFFNFSCFCKYQPSWYSSCSCAEHELYLKRTNLQDSLSNNCF